MECSSKLCIICSQEAIDNDSHLVSPKTYDSWLTMLKAATIRKHNAIFDAAKQLNTGKSLKSITTENVEMFLHSRETWTLFQKQELIKSLALMKRMLTARQNDCAEDHLNLGPYLYIL